MLDNKTDDVEPVTTSASNKQETPQTTPARQLKHYEAGLEFRKLWNSVRKEDRSEVLIYIQLVSKHEEEKIEKEELERRRAHLKDESKEFQEMHEKKLLKCLGRYRSYINRCHRLSGYRPHLTWQSTAEIENELEGYNRLEQFDEFWKRLRKMESKISEMECFYFPYQIYFHEEDIVEFFVMKWNGFKKAIGNAKISKSVCPDIHTISISSDKDIQEKDLAEYYLVFGDDDRYGVFCGIDNYARFSVINQSLVDQIPQLHIYLPPRVAVVPKLENHEVSKIIAVEEV